MIRFLGKEFAILTRPAKISKLITAAAILLIVFCALLVRAKFGFDWSDEGYYSASAIDIELKRLDLTGNYSIHQTSSLLLLPVTALYRSITGGTKGIMLFLRYLYCIVAVLTSSIVFATLYKRKHSLFCATGCALLVMLTCPANVMTLSYNTISFMSITSSFFLIHLPSKNTRFRLFGAGALYAIAVQAYPLFLISLPVFLVYLFLENKFETSKKREWQSMIPFISGVGLVFSLFLLMLFVNTPISNVLENIRNMFRDPEHQDHNIVLKTKKLIGDIFMLYGRKQLVLYILLMVYAIIGLILKRLEIIVSNKYETIGLLFAACVFIMRVLLALRFNKAASTALNFVSLSFSFLFVFLCLLYDQWYQIGWLYLVSVLAVFVVNTGGNNGLSMASYPLVLAAVSGLMMLDNIQMEEEEKKPHHLIPRFFLYFAVIVLLINTGYYRITSVYRDEKLSVLTSVLEDGPGAGIYTTRDASEQYRSVLRDLADNKSDNEHGPVLISKLMPFGYMYLERPAAAPNVWRTYMNETRLSVFYERHPQLIPETIVVLDAGTGFHNQNNPMGGYFNERFLSEEYSSIIKETAVIYQRSKHVSNRQYYSTNKRDRVH